MDLRKTTFFLLIFSLLSSCQLHRVSPQQPLTAPLPESYSAHDEETQCRAPWWEELGDEELKLLMQELFCENLQLQAAWNRVQQAAASAQIALSAFSPQLTIGADLGRISQGGEDAFELPGAGGVDIPAGRGGRFTNFSLSALLSYEVDLWRKIDAAARAACENLKATKQEMDQTALELSAMLAELWFTYRQQAELLALIQTQVQTSKTQLELVELRFSVAESTGLEVFQQRQQLASVAADLPVAKQLYGTSETGIHVLLGKAPVTPLLRQVRYLPEKLPPRPKLGTPRDLLFSRSDLRAAYHQLMQKDYELAEAIADRLPSLSLSLITELTSLNFAKFFDGELYALLTELSAPVFDGGRRKAEVDRRQAALWEQAHLLGNQFLEAIKEVEDALNQEKEQEKLLQTLLRQEIAAERTFVESQWRYSSGQTGYLDVITALQSLQNVQKRIIVEKRALWGYRISLHKALGGGFTLQVPRGCS